MYRERGMLMFLLFDLASRDHVFAINLPASSERIVPMQVSATSCPFGIQLVSSLPGHVTAILVKVCVVENIFKCYQRGLIVCNIYTSSRKLCFYCKIRYII